MQTSRRFRVQTDSFSEELETRCLLSGVNLVDGVLTIVGTSRADEVVVTESGGDILVSLNKDESQFATRDVDSLVINTGGHKDLVDLRDSPLPASVNAGSSRDTILGSAFDDSIIAGSGSDSVDGNSGNDEIQGYRGADTINGGDGDDTILGGNSPDTIRGGKGSDFILGNNGSDTIGAVVLLGESMPIENDFSQEDTIGGGNGRDTLYGATRRGSLIGNSTLRGNAHNDLLVGAELAYGGEGADEIRDVRVVYGGSGDDEITSGRGGTSISTIFGQSGNDEIRSSGLIYAGNGNDRVEGADDVTVFGGSGDDNIRVGRLGFGTATTAVDGGEGNDTITADLGSGSRDLLIGGDGNDTIDGGELRDVLVGGRGADQINGGEGSWPDVLVGGRVATSVGQGQEERIELLLPILDAWNQSLPYSDRVDEITSPTSSLDFVLQGRGGLVRTVVNDDAVDTLNGGGGQDLFFARSSMDVLDISSSETLFEE